MRFRRFTLLLAETKESFLMAMGGLVAHKLRAALTLLGIVVGVFSIIVSMTAMRVLQKNIEGELSELGAHTFTVDKWPAISFEGPEGWEKYRRRKPLTLGHQQTLAERATLATAVGADMYQYEVTVTDGPRHHSVAFSEGAPEAAPLLDLVQTLEKIK